MTTETKMEDWTAERCKDRLLYDLKCIGSNTSHAKYYSRAESSYAELYSGRPMMFIIDRDDIIQEVLEHLNKLDEGTLNKVIGSVVEDFYKIVFAINFNEIRNKIQWRIAP